MPSGSGALSPSQDNGPQETRTAIREGIASAERGKLRPAEQVFTEMQARHSLHG